MTLFALILALGLVVDDPIVDVENIFRHFAMRQQPPLQAVLTAVQRGAAADHPGHARRDRLVPADVLHHRMMGPYMRPMALNVPVAMLMSMWSRSPSRRG